VGRASSAVMASLSVHLGRPHQPGAQSALLQPSPGRKKCCSFATVMSMATNGRGPVIDLPDAESRDAAGEDLLTLGRRIRHVRAARGLTLEQLGQAVGTTASQLSLVENGHREPRLSLVQSLATALGVSVQELLSPEPPSRRAALEIELERAQRSTLYRGLGLPAVRPSRTLPTDVLESLVGLHAELVRRADAAIATPEEARRANTALRRWMRE